jgi:hypothetical protein
MAATNGGPFKGWTGTLKTMTTNGDGDGVIVVQLDGCPCTLRTWNNSFSDLQSHTLVKNGSLLFNKILNMRVGDRVRVSGLILQEASLSERGSVDDPEWITRFSDVSLATSTGTKATTNTAAINPAQAVATAGGGSDKSPPLSTDSEQSRVPPVQTQNAATANDAEMAAALKNAKEAWNRGDNPAAFNVFLSLANRGNAEAENDLGVMYTKGQGVTADYAEAVKWYGKAAEQGLAGAQHNLGFMYVNGWGVPQDDAEATKWFRKAGDQGNTTAQNNLGIMYQLGRGVPQDYHEAINWFRKAADLGNTDAQKNVTVAYSGNGLYGKL